MQHQQLGFPNHPHCLCLKPREEIQQNIIDHASLANNICGKRGKALLWPHLATESAGNKTTLKNL